MSKLSASFVGVMALGFCAGTVGAEQTRPPQPGADHAHHHDAPAQAGSGAMKRAWTRYPLILPAMGGGRGDRNSAALTVKNLAATSLEAYAPEGGTGTQQSIALEGDRAQVPVLPKVGNYYWITAREESPEGVSVASTAHYFSNPGPAPTELLQRPKHELELVPQPLPREHGSYRESEKWRFLLRFQGQPLAGEKVVLETDAGSRTVFRSDARGLVTVNFPRDIAPRKGEEHGGHGGPPRSKFVLAAEYDREGKHYLTAFNSTYGPDGDRDKNLWAGAGFGLLGMVLAAPLLRRRSQQREGAAS